MIPEHIREFIKKTVRSIWGLEALLLLRATQDRNWTATELSVELRGAVPLAQDILDTFLRAHILAADDGRYRYAPADREVDATVSQLAKLNAEIPLAIAKEIIRAPNDKIQTFVDAFKLK